MCFDLWSVGLNMQNCTLEFVILVRKGGARSRAVQLWQMQVYARGTCGCGLSGGGGRGHPRGGRDHVSRTIQVLQRLEIVRS
jgi:hypothetical protein